MDSALLTSGFPAQSGAGAPPSISGEQLGVDTTTVTNTAGAVAAATGLANGSTAVPAQSQQVFQPPPPPHEQYQLQQLSSLMGHSPLQQQLSALSGLTNGAPSAPAMTNNGLNLGQGFPMAQQQQQSLVHGGFPQGFNPQLMQQLVGSGVGLNLPQQQQHPSDHDQASIQGFGLGQQLGQGPHQLSQGPQGFNQLQQLQQLMMTQQLLAQSGGMMPGNLSAMFPLPNPIGHMAQPSLMAPWPGMAPPMQQQGFPHQGGAAANAMNMLLSGLAAGGGGGGGGNPTPHALAPPQPAAIATPSKPLAESEWADPFFGKGKKEPPFPLKLHQILGNPEFSECIAWNPHGRSWRILKPPVFEQIVIPLYFRHAKYASFMRQVNGWGFKRVVSGNDHNSYCHEWFVRDSPQTCLKMKRIKKKSDAAQSRKGDSDDDENEGGLAEDVILDKPQPPGIVPSLPQLPFQQIDMIGAHQTPGILAALQSMQGAGASMLHPPSFPLGFNPSSLAGLTSSATIPGIQNADPQWMLAGLLAGSGGAAGGPNTGASGLSALAGVGQLSTVGLIGGQQQGQQQTELPIVGSTPVSQGDPAGVDSALLAKFQEAVQRAVGTPIDVSTASVSLGQCGPQLPPQIAPQPLDQTRAEGEPPATDESDGGEDDDDDDDDDDASSDSYESV